MLSSVKQKIKRSLNLFGIEVHRFNSEQSSLARLTTAMQTFDIDLVIDIGANDGQFSQKLRTGGYQGRIVSFEPLTSSHARLLKTSRHDPAWQVHARCAIGASQGKVNLNISGNSVSSSILPMLSTHRSAAPDSEYISHESVPLTTLDIAALSYLKQSHAPLIKIDTQGYEWHVLDGAEASLRKASGILIELSLVSLYDGDHLWRDYIERLEAEGFELWSLEPAFIDINSGRTLQWDGLFFRP